RAQEARSTPSRMTSFMIAHFAELDAHNPNGLRAASEEMRWEPACRAGILLIFGIDRSMFRRHCDRVVARDYSSVFEALQLLFCR
ncbi:hypothetical protein NKI89_19330, partial [Mesorhizobium sp. M0309]|uniref:hypothetical protein n=1 Tax=Mesorhizobium sp. M0309 TaxID=2956933 RepID=UPI00333A6413